MSGEKEKNDKRESYSGEEWEKKISEREDRKILENSERESNNGGDERER